MALQITDKDVDNRLKDIVRSLNGVGIKASKTDAIRWLLHIKKQGKKTNKQWKKVLG